jgi:hypothetical protein
MCHLFLHSYVIHHVVAHISQLISYKGLRMQAGILDSLHGLLPKIESHLIIRPLFRLLFATAL